MKSKLFGIGTGPGDPELLTIKAVNTIKNCDIIAVPEAGNDRTAFSIVEKYLEGKELLECRFAMVHDQAKRIESRQSVADSITGILETGKDVGFITLGDPTTYSTYMYVHKIVVGRGYDAEIIPGITSYAAAAAAFGDALCEGSEALTLLSGHGENIELLLDRPGTKVIMKSGASFAQVLDRLKQRGHADRVKIACRVTMGNQRLYESIEEYEKSAEADYFTVAIVKGIRD